MVSNKLSPLFVLEMLGLRLKTSAPRRFAASSKLSLVRVEFSKKALTTLLPARIFSCLSMFLPSFF